MGLIVLMENLKLSKVTQSIVPIVYWAIISAILTVFTALKIKKTYDDPMRKLADAADRVAHGDFSVYVPTTHTAEKWDYLDLMLVNFNKMVEELGSIEVLKTGFFSNVSHEFKTPLAVIQGNAELLRRKGLPEEERRECVDNILSATRRLSGLITNMLKLDKLKGQTISSMPQRYDICRQLCDIALQFEEVWESKGIDFCVDIEDGAEIYADEELLASVWSNLLSNAFKFTEKGGEVTLTQKTEGEYITVSVSDTGCGMDEETSEKIFDKFYQGDSSHATEGNGLGLSIVKRILELSSGEINVESEVGKGSRFTVKLPRNLELAEE